MAAATRGTDGDPYAVLGVDRRATDAQIRAAYRALVARYHPDRHQGNPLEELAAARMIEINQAYEILSDARRRAAHDGSAGAARTAGATAGATGPARPDDRQGRSEAARRLTGLILIIAAMAALPLLFRLGGGLFHAVAILPRAVLEAAEAIRGTPIAAVLVLVALALLAWVALRRRRKRRRAL